MGPGQEAKNGLAGTVSIRVNPKYLRTLPLPLKPRAGCWLLDGEVFFFFFPCTFGGNETESGDEGSGRCEINQDISFKQSHF